MRTFKIGGVHPHDNKQFSAHRPITECPLPKQAIIPLVQHIGAPAQAVVAVGAKVKVGELLAKAGGFVSANICSPVSGTVTGPLTIAAMVVGTENLLIGMVKKPDKVKQLMEVITENNERYIARMLEMGIGVGFADPVSTTSLLRVKQYKEFSLPYFQHNVDFIKKNGGGCGLHICGGSRKLWETLNETGIGCFGLDNIEDLEEAKEVLGPHMAIQGNIPPVDVIRLGTPQDVLRSGRECIRKAWDSPNGFTLTSGCQTPMDTPAENLQALMDAARIFGRYPINQELLNSED